MNFYYHDYRDERPPQISSPNVSSGNIDQHRWVPPSSLKRNVNSEERDNVIFRKVRGILNKLTPEKFDKLSLELLNIGIDSKHILKGIILLIFEKALDEPKYSSLYAQLCHRLCEDAPNFEAQSSKITSFKRLLLNKCQDEFENRSRAFEAFDKDATLSLDEEIQCAIAKHKMLGNIKFIGELGKLDMLHEGILHRCIQQLLEKKKKKQTVQELGEDYECLCQILRTVGKRLDHDKARLWMDQYFDRIKTLIGNPELPLRIKFMLLDVLELRSNQWTPRKILLNVGPKTIQQVREEALREYGIIPPPTSAMANMSMNNNTDLFGRPLNGTLGPPKSSMGDIFGPMSPPFSGSNTGIGTGPGVLPVDDFTPAFMSGNPGRQNNFNLKNVPYGNRGQKNERGGGNSPRFNDDRHRNRNNNSPQYQHPEKEADREDDGPEPTDRERNSNSWAQNRNYGNNRYNNNNRDGNRDRDRETGGGNYDGSQNYFNKSRDKPNNYNTKNDANIAPPKFSQRQRSPYQENEDQQQNRSSNDNWRRSDNREDEDQKRGNRSGPYRNQDGPQQSRGRESQRDEDGPQRRAREWDRTDSGDRDWKSRESRDGFNQSRGNRDDYNRDNRDDRGRDENRGWQPPPRRDNWDSYDNKQSSYNRDNSYNRRDNFDNKRSDYRNGDDSSQSDRYDRGNRGDQDRDFHGGRDFRNNREGGGGGYNSGYNNRDGGYNKDGNRDFNNRDGNKGGFRDFGEARDRGGFDKDRGSGFQNFQRGGGGSSQNQQNPQQRDQNPPASAARELPPRFQRKQQQQQSPQPDPLFPTEINSPVPDDLLNPISTSTPPSIPPGAPPQRYRHPLQQQQQPPPHNPAFFPPRFPPPGGPPMRPPGPRVGFSGGPPPHMAPRYGMGGSGSPRDHQDRDGTGSSPGGPSHPSPPHQNLPKGPAKVDEISLRPARNFPTLLRPSAPSMLPRSAQNPHSSTMQQHPVTPDLLGPGPGGPQPGAIKPTNLTIKQIPSADKDKKDRRKVPNKEELKQNTDELLKTFLESGDVSDTVNAIRDMKPPRRYMPEMISNMIIQGLTKGDSERENISVLIQSMKQEGVLASDLYLDGLCSVLDRMGELEQEIPLVKSNVARFAAQAVAGDIISMSTLAGPLENGQHHPLFLLCLQQMHRVRDEEWLTKNFTESKIDLLRMLPECDRTKDRMVEILEDRKLSFMFPLLRVQADLWRQIRVDPNPGNFYKWIKENVDGELQVDAGFINILVTIILKYITGESTLRSDQDPNNPDKGALDKEKDLVDKYKGVLQRFLLDNVGLQMTAIYSIQVFGHSVEFPKGFMLRMFMHMYDLEIIDEDTFLKWKEEVNDEYPGKGKVLFQVHQWLTWLEQAEEESEEEET